MRACAEKLALSSAASRGESGSLGRAAGGGYAVGLAGAGRGGPLRGPRGLEDCGARSRCHCGGSVLREGAWGLECRASVRAAVRLALPAYPVLPRGRSARRGTTRGRSRSRPHWTPTPGVGLVSPTSHRLCAGQPRERRWSGVFCVTPSSGHFLSLRGKKSSFGLEITTFFNNVLSSNTFNCSAYSPLLASG